MIDNCHNYSCPSGTLSLKLVAVEDFPSLPVTPSKSPPSKKSIVKQRGADSDIIATLSTLINTRSGAIEKMVSLKIEGLQKTIDFACSEIKDMKNKLILVKRGW